jgi:hypothetical protein
MHSAPVCGAAGGNDLEFIVAGSDFRLNGVRLGASLAGNLSSELISITGIAPGTLTGHWTFIFQPIPSKTLVG